MSRVKRGDNEWWHDFFPEFRAVFGLMPAKNTTQQVKFLTEKLGLRRGSSFLDCPCGIGRISLPLARKGIKVTGVDITPVYLEELEAKAKRGKLKVNLVESDMRRINFKNEFDAAGNLWTSFGYFEKESENKLVLKKLFQALKPGGRLMLHLINRDWVLVNFQKNGWFEINDMKVLENRTFDYQLSLSHERWHFFKDRRESCYDTTIRLYSYHELYAMLESVGFKEIEGFSSVKEEPIDKDCRMMWLYGRKPA